MSSMLLKKLPRRLCDGVNTLALEEWFYQGQRDAVNGGCFYLPDYSTKLRLMACKAWMEGASGCMIIRSSPYWIIRKKPS